MKNTVYGTLVYPNTYRYKHEILNVILEILCTGNFYTRQITASNVTSATSMTKISMKNSKCAMSK